MLQLPYRTIYAIKTKAKARLNVANRLLFSFCYTTIILFTLASQHVVAQLNKTPYGLNYKTYKTIPERNFESIDTAFLERQHRRTSGTIVPETIGYNFKIHFIPDADGAWKTVLPGVNSWFLKLRSEGAYGLALVFTNVELLPGEALYVYNQNGLRGPYTNHDIPRSNILPLDFLKGDEIMIEYDVPAGSKRGSFVIETVSHAYQNIFAENVHYSKEATARTDNDCYLCVEDDAIAKERRAVVRLVVQYDSTAVFCTGTLVNNSAHDNKPYILTAQHCVSNQFDADRTVFQFGFENGDCVKLTNHNNDLVLNGSYYRASLFENDFAMLEMYDKPPLEFHPYYAGWDISDQYLNGVTCVHHPQGGPKKVSVSNGTVRTSNFDDGSSRAANAFWNVARWDVGVTEGGSSGASLFNKNNNVIGTLSGGSSACGAPYNDYFEKLSASWEASPDPDHQLKYWLDPINSGVKSVNGNDPFKGINATCNTVSNIKTGEQQVLAPYTNGLGYFAGYNSDSIASYAERFSTADTAMLTSVTLNIGSVNAESSGGLLVSVHSSNGGVPGATLSDSYIPYYRLTDDSLNYIEFYPYVKLAGEFFISYTLSYSPGDSFALWQADWRSNSDNTAFVKLSSGWVPMSNISPSGAGSSLGIKITICEDDLIDSPPEETAISFYPNPAATVLIGKLPDHTQEEFGIEVYDLQGRLQTVMYSVYENNVVITTADLSAGMYIVRLSTAHRVYQSKFVK